MMTQKSRFEQTRALRPAELAEQIGVPIATLERWRNTGRGPRFVRLNPRCFRYLETDVLSWLESRAVDTDDAPAVEGDGR